MVKRQEMVKAGEKAGGKTGGKTGGRWEVMGKEEEGERMRRIEEKEERCVGMAVGVLSGLEVMGRLKVEVESGEKGEGDVVCVPEEMGEGGEGRSWGAGEVLRRVVSRGQEAWELRMWMQVCGGMVGEGVLREVEDEMRGKVREAGRECEGRGWRRMVREDVGRRMRELRGELQHGARGRGEEYSGRITGQKNSASVNFSRDDISNKSLRSGYIHSTNNPMNALLNDGGVGGGGRGVTMGYDEKARKCSLRSRGRGESEGWMREVLASWEEGMREVEREKGEVVAANMGLVYGLAGKFVRGAEGLEFEDLVQEGGIALMKAVDKFEVKRGLRFSTYATWWVRQALTRAIGESRGVMRAPVHVLESFAAMKRMEAKCWREGMGKVGDEELDLMLGWPAGKVADLRAKMRGELAGAYGVTGGMRLAALDGDVRYEEGEGSGLGVGSRLDEVLMGEMSGCAQGGGGFGASYEESRAEQERDEAVRKLLGRLGEQEREVIMMRFGIAGNRVMTLEEVGARFGVTRERIRQIEMNAMGALRGEGARHLMKKWGQI